MILRPVEVVAVCAQDFGDQSVSPQQAKFAAKPGRVAEGRLFVVGLGEEDGRWRGDGDCGSHG